MKNAKITNIKDKQKKISKTPDQLAQDELSEYLSNSIPEPDAIASGDMKKIIDGTEEDDNEKE